jgi:hypothetical protein
VVVGGAGGTGIDGVDGVWEPGCDALIGAAAVPVSGKALPEREVLAPEASEGAVLVLPSPPPQEASKDTAAAAQER